MGNVTDHKFGSLINIRVSQWNLKMSSFLFLLLVILVTSPAGNGLETINRSIGRSLLQIRRDCSEDFENKNYTVITSQCKGPRYSKEACCGALTTFACPYADLINDEKTNCATTMFSYINVIGNYPPGLFANTCREGRQGLACPDNTTTQPALQKSSSLASVSIPYPSATLVAEFSMLIFLFHWF